MNVRFGYPETLQATGAALLISGMPTAGWVFCALGLMGVGFRFGVYAQEQEKKKLESEVFFNRLAESGKALVTAASKMSSSNRNDLH
jgi:hypothetical protein